ncbi:MAG: isoleucine--tRNA ligase [Flavobacteriales bacterium]|nr:isoleucine--tRNA ligase [Flavobacteriales bacterium]MBP9078739.1 isoleucine--tRNA ligase [Flavobacteriales bacterium]
MGKHFPHYDELDLPRVATEILSLWEAEDTFGQSLDLRKDAPPFVFYEGPPSANGLPGIHHVMARTIKDIFCRYQTQQGKRVDRKAGWDTHGLPIELGVEKELGITKEDIGRKISIEAYNAACKKAVMRYTDVWNDLTKRIGFWLDLEKPYVTYHTKYIESVWHLLKQLYDEDLLYKGYTIQPYSPAAGTGLSSHELNQPGTYKPVKDTSVVAQFKVKRDASSEWLFKEAFGEVFILAWTTTPWTLPSNCALTVGPKLEYVRVKTFNPYTHAPQTVVLAKARLGAYFHEKNQDAGFDGHQHDGKNIPWTITGEFFGHQLEGVRYEQLLPYATPDGGDAFKVIGGDFVTTEDGTGVVHTAPSFGADDMRVARQHGIGTLTLVDLRGRFKPEVADFAGEYVKAEYYTAEELAAEAKKQGRDKYLSVDERIAIKLKTEGRAFKVEKYEHNYPHCWRTDKPVLYYPLDSWFVRVTAKKDRLIALNKTITWKPASTGTGRFGNWLENLQDWNLSRSRYWGIPLPIWRTDDGDEERCIGSLEQLKEEIARAVDAGVMEADPYASFKVGDMSDANYDAVDIHRPYVDNIVLVSPGGKPMKRETDLIDVWFDSGAMPYAQWHYPFENEATFREKFPAAFIAEGVDQTRGWFYTLHAIATLTQDNVAYQAVVSNGLVLDKHGQKMSKRLGNAVDPFKTLDQYGADAVRWYMISNASPWDNLKFDAEGITEVQRKFFRALFNTYNFFALYANIDGFDGTGEATLSESDRWILSRLNSVLKLADASYAGYEPTIAARAIQDFVVEDLSNWYVRLNRRRFWKGELGADKNAAFQTLHRCLETIAMLSAPIAPFFSDRLYRDLRGTSVHLSDWPRPDEQAIDLELEQRTALAQQLTSLVLSIRKKEGHRVRQPLQKLIVPVTDTTMRTRLEAVRELVLSEVNVKELVVLDAGESKLTKKIKPDFKKLGARMGKFMKSVAAAVNAFTQAQIADLEANGAVMLAVEGQEVELLREDVEITADNVPGLSVASDGALTVALDITLTEALTLEGIARELVSRIQTLRKESGLEVTDRIQLHVQRNGGGLLEQAVELHAGHIRAETLAITPEDQILVKELLPGHGKPADMVLEEAGKCLLALIKAGS